MVAVVAVMVGRDTEFSAVAELLSAPVDDAPAGLVLWGQAGIGKSTIWRAGLELAADHGHTVMMCRPAEAELRLSYAGLTDLLAETDPAVLGCLSGPQRRVLDAALLHGGHDHVGVDQRAVAAAFLSVLDVCAAASPVVLAIDDVQWLDGPSRVVVGHAVRRSRGALAILTTERAEREPEPPTWPCPPDAARVKALRVGALSVGALHHVVREATGRSFARPVMIRIAESSAGNPFYAVQLARSVERAGGTGTLPLPAGLVVGGRLAVLDPVARAALLVASVAAE